MRVPIPQRWPVALLLVLLLQALGCKGQTPTGKSGGSYRGPAGGGPGTSDGADVKLEEVTFDAYKDRLKSYKGKVVLVDLWRWN
jgi:hypothetical protein